VYKKHYCLSSPKAFLGADAALTKTLQLWLLQTHAPPLEAEAAYLPPHKALTQETVSSTTSAHVSHVPPYTCLFSLSFVSTDSRPLPSSVGTPSLCGSHVWGVFQRFFCCWVGFRESVWNALCCSVLVLCHCDCIPRSTDSVFRPLIAVLIVLCAYLLLCVSHCCWNIFLRLLFACSFLVQCLTAVEQVSSSATLAHFGSSMWDHEY